MPFTDLELARLCLAAYAADSPERPGYFIDDDGLVEGFTHEQIGDFAVVFCGSDEIGDWLGKGNLNVSAAQWPLVGCWCHGGAKLAWDSIRPKLAEKILDAHERGDRIWYTGHSRGFGLATCAAQEFGGHALVGFGGHRVGNDKFNEYLRRVVPAKNIRLYANGRDLVTRHPLWVWDGLMGHRVEHPVQLTDIGSFWNRWTPPWGCVTGRHAPEKYVANLGG